MVPDLLSESSSVDKRVDRQRIDLDLALKLYRRYRNYHTVADMMGRNVQSVHKALKGVKSMFLDGQAMGSEEGSAAADACPGTQGHGLETVE